MYQRNHRPAIILSAILALGFALRIPYLTQSIWYDELWSTFFRLENWLRLGNNALYDPHPPLYSVLMFFWIRVFGDGEISIRIPALLSGLFSIILIYLLAERYAGIKTALLSAFLLSTSLAHINYSREARPYSFVLFSSLLLIYTFYKIVEDRKGGKWYLVYFFSCSMAIFSNYYAGIFIVILTMICFRFGIRTHEKIIGINIILLVLICLYLGVKYLFGLIVSYDTYLRPFTFVEIYQLFFDWFLLGKSQTVEAIILLIQVFGIFLFLRGYFLFFKDLYYRNSYYALDLTLFLFLLPASLLVLSLFGSGRIYTERSLLILLPFFLIILARGSIDFKRKVSATITTGALCLVSTFLLYTAFFQDVENIVTKPNPDWRSAAHYLTQDTQDLSNPTFAYATYIATPLSYYSQSIFEDKNLEGTFQEKLGVIESAIGENNPLVVILSKELGSYDVEINERKDNSRVILQYPNLADINDILVEHESNGVDCIYLVNNLIYSVDFMKLLEAVEANPQYKLDEIKLFKNVEIYKFCQSS